MYLLFWPTNDVYTIYLPYLKKYTYIYYCEPGDNNTITVKRLYTMQ